MEASSAPRPDQQNHPLIIRMFYKTEEQKVQITESPSQHLNNLLRVSKRIKRVYSTNQDTISTTSTSTSPGTLNKNSLNVNHQFHLKQSKTVTRKKDL